MSLRLSSHSHVFYGNLIFYPPRGMRYAYCIEVEDNCTYILLDAGPGKLDFVLKLRLEIARRQSFETHLFTIICQSITSFIMFCKPTVEARLSLSNLAGEATSVK